MVAVRTRSRRARQKVSDGNPRSGADRGGRANKARPRRPRRETVAPLSALVGSRAVEEDLRLRQRVTSISAGVGAPRRMASERSRDHSAADRLLAFSRSCGGGARGNLRFLRTRAHTPNSISAAAAAGVTTPKCREPNTGEIHCEREMPRSISHDGFDAKFNVEATVLQVSRDSRTRAAVEPSCTTTRATRADRGPQARVKNYFIQPRPTSEIQHDAAATNASKRSLKA